MSFTNDIFIDLISGEAKELQLEVLRIDKYNPIRVERLDNGIVTVGLTIQVLKDGIQTANFLTTTADSYMESIAHIINQQQSVKLIAPHKYTIKACLATEDVMQFRVFHAQQAPPRKTRMSKCGCIVSFMCWYKAAIRHLHTHI